MLIQQFAICIGYDDAFRNLWTYLLIGMFFYGLNKLSDATYVEIGTVLW